MGTCRKRAGGGAEGQVVGPCWAPPWAFSSGWLQASENLEGSGKQGELEECKWEGTGVCAEWRR